MLTELKSSIEFHVFLNTLETIYFIYMYEFIILDNSNRIFFIAKWILVSLDISIFLNDKILSIKALVYHFWYHGFAGCFACHACNLGSPIIYKSSWQSY